MMKLIGITDERFRADEPQWIVAAFENGLDLLHLRKPGATAAEIESLIRALPESIHPKLVLHDAFGLCSRYGLKGVHLNRRNPEPPVPFRGSVSRSCHSVAELHHYTGYDYLFLSPVCDSISKTGYRAAYPDNELQSAARLGLIDGHVMALGGVTPDTIGYIRQFPFGGVAVLGYLWQSGTVTQLAERVQILRERLNRA